MKIKRGLLIVVGVLVVASLVFAGCAAPAPEEEVTPPPKEEVTPPPKEEVTPPAGPDYSTVKLTLSSPWPATFAPNVGVLIWADEITKVTDGKITFEYFWAGALGTPAEHIDLINQRNVDMVTTHMWYTPTKAPLGNFEYIFPFGPKDTKLVAKARWTVYDEFPEFAEEYARYNCKLLQLQASESYRFMSKEPVNSLSDFEGQKVGLIGRYFGRWVQPSGAVPVVCPVTERYTNLQTGLEDIDLLTPTMAYTYKLHEQAPYIIDVPVGSFIPWQLLINLDTWNELTPDTQKLLAESAREFSQEEFPDWLGTEVDVVIGKMKDEVGLEVLTFPKADLAEWASRIEDIPAEWCAEVEELGLPGWEIAASYQDICEELGFEWARRWAVK